MIPPKEYEYCRYTNGTNDELAVFEPGISVTGIQAEDFRKNAALLSYLHLVYLDLPIPYFKYQLSIRHKTELLV